jgi:hypothetical protein
MHERIGGRRLYAGELPHNHGEREQDHGQTFAARNVRVHEVLRGHEHGDARDPRAACEKRDHGEKREQRHHHSARENVKARA